MALPTSFPAVSFEFTAYRSDSAGRVHKIFENPLEIQISLTNGEWIEREVIIPAGDVTPQTTVLWDVSGTQSPVDDVDDFDVCILQASSAADVDIEFRNKAGGLDEFSSQTLLAGGLPLILGSDRASVIYDATGAWPGGTPTFGTIQRISAFNEDATVKKVTLFLGR